MMDDRTVECTDLADFDDAFADADCDMDGDAEELPDGRYRAVVEKAELEVSRADNKMLVWRMRVLGPQFAGRKLWHRNMIMSKNNLRWLKRDLMTAGLELEKLSELPNRTGELADVMLEIQLKTRAGTQNSFINKRIRPPASAATQATPEQVRPDDDFPF